MPEAKHDLTAIGLVATMAIGLLVTPLTGLALSFTAILVAYATAAGMLLLLPLTMEFKAEEETGRWMRRLRKVARQVPLHGAILLWFGANISVMQAMSDPTTSSWGHWLLAGAGIVAGFLLLVWTYGTGGWRRSDERGPIQEGRVARDARS